MLAFLSAGNRRYRQTHQGEYASAPDMGRLPSLICRIHLNSSIKLSLHSLSPQKCQKDSWAWTKALEIKPIPHRGESHPVNDLRCKVVRSNHHHSFSLHILQSTFQFFKKHHSQHVPREVAHRFTKIFLRQPVSGSTRRSLQEQLISVSPQEGVLGLPLPAACWVTRTSI